MTEDRTPYGKTLLTWSVACTLIVELITVLARALTGMSVTDLHARVELPLVLRTHHMFWGIAVAVVAVPVIRRWRIGGARLMGFGLGLLFSDLVHHFVVLPLWVGHTGWHWP